MPDIFIVTGHTPLSPGGVCGGTTEYLEGKRLSDALKGEILRLCPEISVITGEGNAFIENAGADDILLVLHKGTYDKNSPTHGAEIYVKGDAACSTQYDAYRLLFSICTEGGFSYKGVHPISAKTPFRAFSRSCPKSAFLLKTGYMESERDSIASGFVLSTLITDLATEIIRIYKEKKYEIDTAVYTPSFGGEYFKAS